MESNGNNCDAENIMGLDENVMDMNEENYYNENSSENDFEMYVGMEFESEEAAYEFYNSHARVIGFSIRKGSLVRSKVNNETTSRRFVCAKEGFCWTSDKFIKEPPLHPKPETREGCKAYMGIRKEKSGKWVIHGFEKQHYHNLVSPTKVHRLRSHRHISFAAKSLIDKFYGAGVKPSKIMSVLQNASGSRDLVGFSKEDCTNHIKRTRHNNNVGGDCYRLLDYFQRKQEEDPGFFWAIEWETDGTMGSIFWADSRCRMDYTRFGDVVVFDTTYKTNKYLMPFAPFTGVNHHRQSVLFGCALLSDETKESFLWLFRTWLRAMSDCHPVSIITNQDKAMRKAIVEVFPHTRHRFCLWHINKNGAEHLKHIYMEFPHFKGEYDTCIMTSETEQDFEKSWQTIIMKYNLVENMWLQEMYKQWQHWVPCYLRGTFFAGMQTSQRSESINAFFDGYLSPSLPLNEFVVQYEKALETRRDAEQAEDHNTFYTMPHLTSKNSIEIQASKFYTRKMFIKFQNEFLERDSLSSIKKVHKNGKEKTYSMGENSRSSREVLVIFIEDDLSTRCTCQLFDFEGMPCRYMMAIWQKKGVKEIPSVYLLHRWSRIAKHIPKHDIQIEDNSQTPSTLMIWAFRDATRKLSDLGATSNERCRYAFEMVQELLEKLSSMGVREIIEAPSEAPSEELNCKVIGNLNSFSSQQSIRDRPQAKPKGRPSSTRWKSGLEQGQKRTRTCSECGETGHDMRTCKLHKGA